MGWLDDAIKNGLIGKVTAVRAEAVAAAATHVSASLILSASEAEWSEVFAAFARDHGWRAYHALDSRGSEAGFPDWVLVRRGLIYYVELKDQDGVQSAEQKEWALDLELAGQVVFLWRPSDWPTVQIVLS